jgi:hypothetical protein
VGVLTEQAKQRVQAVIDANIDELRELPNFVAARPGFPLVGGSFKTRPAIIVLVAQKLPPDHLLKEDLAPRRLGGYRVDVMQADPVQQVQAMRSAVARKALAPAAAAVYTYTPPPGNPIDTPVTVTKPILCHVGPDAGWPVLSMFLAATRKQLAVAIYDFNAAYIATKLITTGQARTVDVTMNWDATPPLTNEPETVKDIAGKLKPNFHDVVIPTGSGHAFANSYHEKVAVRDSAAFWLSSGNWTIKSQPDIDPIKTPAAGVGMYGKYNREWHVVLEDKALAAVFEQYIRHDHEAAEQDLKKLKKIGKRAAAATVFPDVFVPLEAVVAAAALPPEPVAPKRLPSGGASYQVQPVLTPDNYRQRVSALLEGAQRSIYMQLAYINYSDAAGDATFTDLLNVVKKKIDQAGVDVRIIVDSRNGAGGVAALVEHGFKQTVFRQQTNIHNKGIVVDGEAVLVSSANWSSDGILRNRDAGLIIANAEVAGYYQQVFLDDWDKRATAIKGPSTAIVARPGAATPPGMVRVSWHEYMDD